MTVYYTNDFIPYLTLWLKIDRANYSFQKQMFFLMLRIMFVFSEKEHSG